MTTANTDAADLENQPFGGIINEDVMQAVFDISGIPLPLLDRIASERSRNQYKSWLKSKLPDPNIDNAVVDGSDASTPVENLATRVGNRHQILEYTIAVSTRARDVDTIGYADELQRQITEYNQAIRRDLNAIALEPQASVVDDGNTTPGRLGGFPSWLETNTFRGAGGADGGFNLTTGLVDAPTPGAARALTETLVKSAISAAYRSNANPSIMHSVPEVMEKWSDYLFESSARIASVTRDENASPPQAASAVGAFNLFLGNHGIMLEFVSDRLQQTHVDSVATQVADVFLYDPAYVAASYLHNVKVEPLGKVGLSDRRQISADATLVVHNEEAHALVGDIDPTLAVTQ